jgi:HAMP domain-containing protein
MRTTITALVLLLAACSETALAQDTRHLDCIREVRATVLKGQLDVMANAAGGWASLSGEVRAAISVKAMADAEQAVEMFQVHSSLTRCEESLAAVHRAMPRLTADERRRAGIRGR